MRFYTLTLTVGVFLAGCGTPAPVSPTEPEISYSRYSPSFNAEGGYLEIYLLQVRASQTMTVVLLGECQFSDRNASVKFAGTLDQTVRDSVLTSEPMTDPPDFDNEYTCTFTATDETGKAIRVKNGDSV
jgi:hypothetical protein